MSWSVSDEEEQDEQESDVAVLEVDPGSPENKKLLEKIQDLESSLQEEKLFRKHLEEENELLKNLLQKSSYFLKEMKQRYDDLKGQVERQNEEHGLTVSDPESFTSLLSSFWGDRTVTATPDDSSLKKVFVFKEIYLFLLWVGGKRRKKEGYKETKREERKREKKIETLFFFFSFFHP